MSRHEDCGRELSLLHPDGSPCFGKDGRIVQLIPAAPGWRAVFAFQYEGKEELETQPVIAFALVEYCSGHRGLDGFVDAEGTIESVMDEGTFRRFLGPGEEL